MVEEVKSFPRESFVRWRALSPVPAVAGQLGSTYVIPVIYVPALMITHLVALYLLLRSQPKTARIFAGDAVASN